MIRSAGRLLPERGFSAKAIYSSFPVTLMCYSPRQQFALYNMREGESQPTWKENGVIVRNQDMVKSYKGLVYPGISKSVSETTISNGAVMYPNTIRMQTRARGQYEDTLDQQENGEEVDTPYIFSVPKGTPVPSHLTLYNESQSRFSLQPAWAIPLEALNAQLDEFYSKNAEKEKVDVWLDKHPSNLALDDFLDAKWMAE
ncbi:hypothetical protein F4808DRAFT_461406 [Astrocystis sublimbata]|nr:hypothetical protein F4808DRAFT_461406 [Astrocystis sublimbata]